MSEVYIFDGHNDTITRLLPMGAAGLDGFRNGRSDIHLDLPRARAGGLRGGMFAICVPSKAADGGEFSPQPILAAEGYEIPFAPPCDPSDAQRFTIIAMGKLFRLIEASGGEMRLARTADEVAAAFREGTLAVVLHFEGAEAIDPDLDALHVFYAAGLRSLGIVWSRPNAFGYGVPFRLPASPDIGPGLTPAGQELVRACNHLGILIDLAHLNERGFWDVAELSTAPLVSTHSAAHALCPSARNLTDVQLDAIGASGGVVGITFHVPDLRTDGRFDPHTPLDEIVRHVEYVARRIGVAHVALGSDFDGALIPTAVGDVAGLPRIVEALREHGFDDSEIRQIAHENWLRVLQQTWRS
ncbi:MAG TPA: membrane dipeptidase [Chloroflexi bacterium]|nr:membrane dipeptidase [Chloroflexota bacterium]